MNKQLFLYGLFLLAFTFFTYLFVDPNLIYLDKIFTGFAYKNRQLVSIMYIFFVLLFFVFYWYFYNRITKKNIKKIIFISIVFLFFSYPAILSFDIFNYIFTAKVFYLYHENPYIVMPIEFSILPNSLLGFFELKYVLYNSGNR